MVPVRVLHIVGAMNRGGAETMLMNLYRAVDKDRVQFDFLEFMPGESHYAAEIKSMGGRILHVGWSQSPTRFLHTINSIASVITKEGPYVAVHSHVLFATGAALLAASKAGVKIRIAHSHNTDDIGSGTVVTVYRALARIMIRFSATDLAACTTDAGAYLFGKKKFLKKGIVIPNAVDICRFSPGNKEIKHSQRQSSKDEPRGLGIISVARMEPAKNHEFLIKLAHELHSRSFKFNMVLIGDGSLRPELEAQVSQRGLSHCVHFLGVREDIDELMRLNDVLVMPSHFEGLPVVLVEAQATGLPCIVSEQITREADMSLGLLEYLSTQNITTWADRLLEPLPSSPSGKIIETKLRESGYTVESSVSKILTMYRLHDFK